MKTLRINFLGATLACLAVSIFCERGLHAAQTNSEPQIVFLHLGLKHNNISLVKITTAPGVVKPSPFIQAGIQYEVISVTGEPLWKGTVADPGERRFECEDPRHSGRLNRKPRHIDDVEFTVRVPAFAAAKQIDFYILEPVAVAKHEKSSVRKPLGSVVLSPNPIPPP